MYKRLFFNNNGASSSLSRGDLTFTFTEPIIVPDDQVVEIRLNDAWFQLAGVGQYIAYVTVDKLTDNVNNVLETSPFIQ